jgi:anti-sigma B factor antagonist
MIYSGSQPTPMVVDFSIQRDVRDSVEIVVVAGELDMASAPTLKEEFSKLDSGEQGVVLDISGLTFIDSHGVRALLSLGDDGRLLVVRPPSTSIVARVLDLSQAERLLSMSDTLEEALQRVRREP